jgi:peptide/nickel transport system substrate-binding protein
MLNSQNKLLTVGLLVAVLMLGVFSATAQESEFSVAINAPVELDPHIGTLDAEILFNRMIYDYLMDISPTGELVPQLATEYSISDDGLTYTLSLRDDVTFHDGTPFTSADVVYTFTRLQEVGSPALNLLGEFTVEADGDNAVVFMLTAPNADFLFGVASRWSFIVMDGMETPNVIAEGDAPYANFVGTGAFTLSNYSASERADFAANDSYWAENMPASASVSHIYIEEEQTQIDALRSGTVDYIFRVSLERVEELEGEGLVASVKATNQHPVIRIRSDEGSLGEDVRIRQAFKFATDREILNLDLFDGRATIGNNDPIGPTYGVFYDASIENQEYDPARACELLAEAGYPDGLGADEPIEFYVVDAFNYVQMAEFLQQQWADGCINVEILPRSEGDYYAGDLDVAEWMTVDLGVTGWGSRPIPQQYLLEAYVTGASFNESHFSDEELDALVAEASVTADIDTRAGLYSQIAQIFADRGPIIVPFFAPIVGVGADGVEGVDMHSFPGRTDLRTAVVNG